MEFLGPSLVFLFRVSCHHSIGICWRLWLPLGCSIQMDYAAFYSKPVSCLYKDTSVHYIVQFNSSFCSVNTVSFMMVFCIFMCLPLGNSCGKSFYILIFIYTQILEYFDAIFSDLDIHFYKILSRVGN